MVDVIYDVSSSMTSIVQGADVPVYKELEVNIANQDFTYSFDLTTNNKIWQFALTESINYNMEPTVTTKYNDWQIMASVSTAWDYSICGDKCLTKYTADTAGCSGSLNCNFVKGRIYRISTTCYWSLSGCNKATCTSITNDRVNFEQIGTCPVKCQPSHLLSLDPTYTTPTEYDKDSTDLTFNIDLTAKIVNTGSMALSYGRVIAYDSSLMAYTSTLTGKFAGMFVTRTPVVTVSLPTVPVEFPMTDFKIEVFSYTCATVDNTFRNADTTNLVESRLVNISIPFRMAFTYCTTQTYGLATAGTLTLNLNKG